MKDTNEALRKAKEIDKLIVIKEQKELIKSIQVKFLRIQNQRSVQTQSTDTDLSKQEDKENKMKSQARNGGGNLAR